MAENHFDAIIIGTGLVESILAAALSKAGCKVAHIDSNTYYGGDEATLSMDELAQWADSLEDGGRFASASRRGDILPQGRQYSICLRPTIISSVGPMITALIGSGVSKYSGFRLVESVSVYESPGKVRSVPGSKEDIFQSKEITLIEKRRLMRFLTSVSGEIEGAKELEGKEDTPFIDFAQSVFGLSEETARVIGYALCFCVSPSDATLPTLRRLQGFMRSSGRYGTSPFLVGHYGGIGDIAQGFCRASAVNGGVYILGRRILSLESTTPFTLTLEDFPENLTSTIVIGPDISMEKKKVWASSSKFSNDIARCVAIIDKPLSMRGTVADGAVLVFRPGTVQGGSSNVSATGFVTGEASMSCPRGKWIIYLAIPLIENESPETALDPYLDAILTLSEDRIEPLFTVFYLDRRVQRDPQGDAEALYFVPAPLQVTPFPELGDEAARIAFEVFTDAIDALQRSGLTVGESDGSFWPPVAVEEEDEEE